MKTNDIRNSVLGKFNKSTQSLMCRPLFLIAFLFSLGCSKDDACTKTVIVPEYMIGSAYYPEQKLEVACDFPESEPIGKLKKSY